MKKLLLLLVLIASTIQCSSEENAPIAYLIPYDETQEDSQTRGDCSFSTQIINISTSENAQNRPNAVSVPAQAITEPGSYCLSNSIQSNSSRIIRIESNDVTIDLNGQQLEATGNNTAISLQNNLRNIQIFNGTIRGGTGIAASGVRELRIEEIRFINNRRAINITGDRDIVIFNCLAESSSIHGYQLTGVTNGFIFECRTSGGISTSSGFLLTNLNNFVIQKCKSNNNAQGYNCIGCNNLFFFQCESNGNRGDGFKFVNDSNGSRNANNEIVECTAQTNRGHGFFIFGNAHSLQESWALQNSADGFFINGTNHTLLNNIAKRNFTGFNLLPSARFCQVRENTATANARFGFANSGTAAAPNPNRIYTNFANNNGTNFNAAIPNVFVSPTPATPINFTTNIAE